MINDELERMREANRGKRESPEDRIERMTQGRGVDPVFDRGGNVWTQQRGGIPSAPEIPPPAPEPIPPQTDEIAALKMELSNAMTAVQGLMMAANDALNKAHESRDIYDDDYPEWPSVIEEGGGKESIPISFWPELRRDEDGNPELVVADGLVRLVGHGYIPFAGGTFPAAWGHCAWIARNYADCNNAGQWNFGAGDGVQYGPEPEESLEAGVIVLCRIVGGTNNEQLAINRIGDQDVFDLVRRVEPVPLYDPEIEFDPELAPIVADAGDDVEAVVGSTIVFDGRESTTDARIRIMHYRWSDGPWSDNINGERPAYKFSSAGEWTITLEVEDQAGRQATDTVTVTIIDPEAE